MHPRGKFIVIEGIDGSGKGTQVELLARALKSRGIPFSQVSFPNYSGFFGRLVAQFLNGEFGALESVDPRFASLLYAGDRLESRPALESALSEGKTLLSDRYIASNMAHQGSRVTEAKRRGFLAWLHELEYGVYALPQEDLVVYLKVPTVVAHHLVGEKSGRTYTNLARDLQEANFAHLQAASAVYDELAEQPHWVTIKCFDASVEQMRSPQAIHEEVLSAVEARVLNMMQGKNRS